MPAIIITVAGKEEGTGKTFKATDSTGKVWYFWKDQWNFINVGKSYSIDSFKTKPFQGKDYHYVDKYTAEQSPSGGAVSRIGGGGGSSVGPAPGYRPPEPTNKDKQIYVCGILNNIMANPNTNPESLTLTYLVSTTRMAMEAFDQTLGHKTFLTTDDLKAAREEMNDEIGF